MPTNLPIPVPFGPILPVQEGTSDEEPQTDSNESYVGFDPWGDSQENPLLVGPTRTFYDYAFEYDETLNGQEDTRDLPGGNLADTFRGIDEYAEARADPDQSTAGTDSLIGLVVGGVALMVVLYLIRPLLEIGAAVAEDEGE